MIDGRPARSSGVGRARPVSCPFCDGRDTEVSSAFGSHASVSMWWCRACRSPFEVFKWGNHPDERPDPDESPDADAPSSGLDGANDE